MANSWKRIVLVLSGGNAVGAFGAGAYEALDDRGVLPDLISGASIGALNGALVAANRVKERVPRLRALWDRLALPANASTTGSAAAVATARTLGRWPLFMPVMPRMLPNAPGEPGLYDLAPLRHALAELADLEFLPRASCRLMVVATDLTEGLPVIFDSAEDSITSEHIQASCSLTGDFTPVEVDGKLFCDGGLSMNLPVGIALSPPPQDDTLCIAVDLFDRAGAPPETIDEAFGRRLDLSFAAQTRFEFEALTHLYTRNRPAKGQGKILVAHLRRDSRREQVGQKVFDFSSAMIERRWRDGHQAMSALLDRLPKAAECGAFSVVEARG